MCSVAKSCPILCVPVDCSLPGFSVHRSFQARILKWVAISFFRGSSWPRDQTHFSKGVSCIGRHILYHWSMWEAHLLDAAAKSLQSCLTLSDPMDCSLPGSSVRGILQARILEWVVIPFFRGSFQPRDWTKVSCIADRFFTFWATWEAYKPDLWPQSIYILIGKNKLDYFR